MITRQNSLAYVFGLGFYFFFLGGGMVGERKIFGEIIEDPKERREEWVQPRRICASGGNPNSRPRGLMWLQ